MTKLSSIEDSYGKLKWPAKWHGSSTEHESKDIDITITVGFCWHVITWNHYFISVCVKIVLQISNRPGVAGAVL